MADDLGNKLMSLNSLWNPHYFAKTGFYTALGAETAQGLPNAQIFYSFLRGAAKQFGNWIWGNASIYNRFGFKQCAMRNTTAGGQECVCDDQGSSLSLFRRLMYQQLLCALTPPAALSSPWVSLTCSGCSDCAVNTRRRREDFWF